MERQQHTDLKRQLRAAREPEDAQKLLEASGLDVQQQLNVLIAVCTSLGKEVDRLKGRVTDLMAGRFTATSERAPKSQLLLFNKPPKLLTPKKEGEPDKPTDKTPDVDLDELREQTERDIEDHLRQAKEAALAERERRRQALKEAGAAAAHPWPEGYPVRVEEICPDLACPDPECDKHRNILRWESSWRWEQKITVEIVVTRRAVVACSSHHGGPVVPPAPPKPVDHGHLGFGVAARAIYLRFSHHNMPIASIVQLFKVEGLPVSEEMLHTLYDVTAERGTPMYLAILENICSSNLVNLDDTPVLLLDLLHPNRKRIGRIWFALGDDRWPMYLATATWKATEIGEKLKHLSGTVQGDGYKGYMKLARKYGWVLAGCMAHLRRKIRKALLQGDPRAERPMALIQSLYRIEKIADLKGLDATERLAFRRERSVPFMEALEQWAREVAPTIEEGSPLGAAWTYLDNQWDLLCRFLENGHVKIDNNAAERGLRRITIGRKLWLFFRGERTLERAAKLATLLMAARMHGADELAYMTWVLERLATRDWSVAAAHELLPDVWLRLEAEKKGEKRAAA